LFVGFSLYAHPVLIAVFRRKTVDTRFLAFGLVGVYGGGWKSRGPGSPLRGGGRWAGGGGRGRGGLCAVGGVHVAFKVA